jgi:hypothetical protein
MEQVTVEGKKVFFLYPHSVIQDEMLDVLIMSGYEVYILRDHKRAYRLLERFPGSIMCINIDERLPEMEWEAYIRELQESPKTRDSKLGILSYNTDRDLMQKYLMDMAVPCGYIQLKLGVQASTKIIHDALQANEAKGRRKCFRASCEDDSGATINYKDGNTIYYGKILDISSAGVAVRIENFRGFQTNSRLRDIQLKLRGSLVRTDMILIGNRWDNQDVWILLFNPNMPLEGRLIIHRYMKQILQRYIDEIKA